jgi:DNA repair protein RadA/Sms
MSKTKTKTIWCCVECGASRSKWLGQCPTCQGWNTLKEELEAPLISKKFEARNIEPAKPVRLKDVSRSKVPRVLTHVQEFDRLIGGGIVAGTLALVGGDPGIGKSTLLLQISNVLAKQGLTVLYICGEESVEQTAMRAERLEIDSEHLLLLSETQFSAIDGHIRNVCPDVIIVDSIQIVYKDEISSAPGSVTQVREVTTEFMHIAKGRGISVFLVGHVTKSGEIAGPRVLEHLVDTVLYFEGDKQHNYRMLRCVKNRFGPTDEVAVFQMTSKGLAEVPNPSEIFLEERRKDLAGSVIIPTIEGSRPILVEVQALVTESPYSTPARRSAGIDQNRLNLLLAVLERRVGYKMHKSDVFVSVAGGLRIMETAIDLPILLAVASSLCNKPIDSASVVLGEVGLGGEIRSVPRVESRIKEAINLGFERAIIPSHNIRGIPKELTDKIQVTGVDLVEEAIDALIT